MLEANEASETPVAEASISEDESTTLEEAILLALTVTVLLELVVSVTKVLLLVLKVLLLEGTGGAGVLGGDQGPS